MAFSFLILVPVQNRRVARGEPLLDAGLKVLTCLFLRFFQIVVDDLLMFFPPGGPCDGPDHYIYARPAIRASRPQGAIRRHLPFSRIGFYRDRLISESELEKSGNFALVCSRVPEAISQRYCS